MYSPYISACARSPPIFSTHFACLLERMNESMAELKDQYGNPIRLTDEYGNPMYVTRAVPGSTTFPSQVSSGSTTLPPHISSVGEGGGVGDSNLMSGPGTGVISGSEVSRLHDTGELVSTSSSSSSEDDGLGRRRKRGLRQKIKEKLGGGGKHEDPAANGMMYGEHDTEKKSMMEKIKDRLPGHHHAH